MPERGVRREPVWFRRPSPGEPGDPGTLNATYQLLDRAVVAGRADDVALEGMTFARLLTDVAAFAGALRGFAVVPGDRVLLHLPDGADLAVGLLAGLRLGAVVVLVGVADVPEEVARALDSTEPRVVVTADETALGLALADADHAPGAVILAGDGAPAEESADAPAATGAPPPLPWALAMRAGQTDPAGAADVAATTPGLVLWPDGSAGPDAPEEEVRLRTTLDLATTLGGLDVPLTVDALLAAVRDRREPGLP